MRYSHGLAGPVTALFGSVRQKPSVMNRARGTVTT